MKFESLSMVNWGPYLGEHDIDLTVTDDSPVIVFYAENGHGKTSILSALKWCLYGKTIYRSDGRTVRSLASMVNLEALSGGNETPFGVTIKMEHRNQRYVLKRKGLAVQEISGDVKLIEESVSLMPDDGPPLPQQDIAERINSILNEEVSDFFLFDGEMLGRFEERLKESETSRGFIRKQVERALGLPFLQTLLGDLESVQTKANKEIEASNRKNRQTEKARSEMAKQTDLLDSRISDLEKVTAARDVLNDEIENLQAQLEKVEPIRELATERRSLESRIAEASNDLVDIKDQIKAILEDEWWFPLEDVLRAQHEKLENDLQTATQAANRRVELDFLVRSQKSLLEGQTCGTCGQEIPQGDMSHVHEQISKAETELAQIPDSQKPEELLERLKKIRPFTSRASAVERIQTLELDYRRGKVRIDKDKQRIRLIDDQLGGNRPDVAALESQMQTKKADREKAENLIETLEQDKQRLKEEINEISKSLRNTEDVDSNVRDLLNLAEESEQIVKEAFLSFREQMRMRVQAHASELFQRLSSEEGYNSVTIGQDYSLHVSASDSKMPETPVELSAGFNQVLTVSFIGALGESSVDAAPLVMDTPFSRLDVGHRRAILDWISDYKPQAILFTHSGEMARETDREFLRESIAREYIVRRLGVFSSEIRRLEND